MVASLDLGTGGYRHRVMILTAETRGNLKSKVKSQIEEVKPASAHGFHFFNLTSYF
jgi:hypothetical protein